MKRFSLFSLAGLVLSGIVFLPIAFSQTNETLTIATYYPSPYGVYSEMRLYPKADATCNTNQIGLMYYDNTPGEEGLKVCGGSPLGWQSLGGYWTLSSNNLYPTNTTSWNVGIGTISPGTAFDLNGAFSQRQMSAPLLSPLNQGRLYFDSTSKKFRVSENGTAYVDLIGGGGGGWTDDGTVVRLTTITDKVGIGTTGPQFKLEVKAESYDGLRIISTGTSPALRLDTDYGFGGYRNWAIYTNFYNPGDFVITSSNAAGGIPNWIRFLITSTGMTSIGNTGGNSGAILQIRGYDDLNTSYTLMASGDGGSDGLFLMNSGNVSIGYNPGPTDHFQVGEYGFPGFFTKRFGVQKGSNNLYAFGLYQTAWSDKRLKQDIQPQQGMLERIMALKPVTYF